MEQRLQPELSTITKTEIVIKTMELATPTPGGVPLQVIISPVQQQGLLITIHQTNEVQAIQNQQQSPPILKYEAILPDPNQLIDPDRLNRVQITIEEVQPEVLREIHTVHLVVVPDLPVEPQAAQGHQVEIPLDPEDKQKTHRG